METPIYQNAAYSTEERVKDLLGRMTLEEKARQLDMFSGVHLIDKTVPSSISNAAAAPDAQLKEDEIAKQIGPMGAGSIHDLYPNPALANAFQRYAVEHTRLHIPFLLIEEGLHGFGKPGCSNFPSQINLASSFEPSLAAKSGHAIASEFRACGVHKMLGPTMDLARDPRWGRVEEGYGEDVCLASAMAKSFVQGMQGESVAQQDAIIAEPKHFTAHGIPENGVNCAPAHIGMRELFTEILPIFEAAIKEGGAYNVMCSYNSIDGQPCVTSKGLLTGVLRDRWKLRGFVLTDLGAMSRLENNHHTAASPEDAIWQSLEAGVDMQFYDYPHDVHFDAIVQGVRSGRLSMDLVDQAVSRVLRVKFDLGLFENPYVDESLFDKVNHCQAHQELALEIADKSLILLKNNGVLPLREPMKLAVVGPHAQKGYFDGYTQTAEGMHYISILDGLRETMPAGTEILYDDTIDPCLSGSSPLPDHWYTDPQGRPGLSAAYYATPDFSAAPVAAGHDAGIHTQHIATIPHSALPPHNYGIRWEGFLTADEEFEGRLVFGGHESVAVYLDDVCVLDCMGDKRDNQGRAFSVTLRRGVSHKLRVDLIKDQNGQDITLGFEKYARHVFEKAEAIAAQADLVLAVMGDIRATCGEGHDRSELVLPFQQRELLKALKRAGKPVVLVLQNGRPVELSWESEHVDAILEAFAPGEAGGLAIARALYGVTNPAGRLPISFPCSVGSLPCYYSYMVGRNDVYLERIPRALYPFGHGLSYTTFAYDHLDIQPDGTPAGFQVTFDVTNTGERAGDEVVQLYVTDVVSSVVRPERELKAFKRISLEPGQTQRVSLQLGPDAFKVLDKKFRFMVEKGEFVIRVGASCQDIRLQGSLSIPEDILLEEVDIAAYMQ